MRLREMVQKSMVQKSKMPFETKMHWAWWCKGMLVLDISMLGTSHFEFFQQLTVTHILPLYSHHSSSMLPICHLGPPHLHWIF